MHNAATENGLADDHSYTDIDKNHAALLTQHDGRLRLKQQVIESRAME